MQMTSQIRIIFAILATLIPFCTCSTPTTTPTPSPTSGTFKDNESNSSIFAVASGNEFVFEGLQTLLDDDAIATFEETTLSQLATKGQIPPGASEIAIESVQVTSQSLHFSSVYVDSAESLHVFFDVACLVQISDATSFNFSHYVADFFAKGDIHQELLSLFTDKKGADFSTKHPESGGNTTLIVVVAVAGVALIVVGVLVMRGNCTWPKADSSRDDNDGSREFSTKPTDSNDDKESCDSDDKPAASEGDESVTTNRNATPALSLNLMYRPTLLPMESNIEIPMTPTTSYEPSQFSPTGTENGDAGILGPFQQSDDYEQDEESGNIATTASDDIPTSNNNRMSSYLSGSTFFQRVWTKSDPINTKE